MQVKTTVDVREQAGVTCAYGVVQVQGFQLSVYSFCVDGVLIDTGSQTLLEEFMPYFQSVDVDQVVMTHAHEDHVGGSKWIQDHLGVPLSIHSSSVERCRQPFSYKTYRQIMWGQAEPFHAEPLEKTFTSRNDTWEVIDTPGHASDHVCFYNRDRKVLFSGDLFVQVRTKVILEEEQILQTMASLEKVLSYEFETVYCNHAGYLPNGRRRLEQKLAYLREIQQNVQDLHAQGLDEQAITDALFPKKYPIIAVSEGEWGAHHIVAGMLLEKASS